MATKASKDEVKRQLKGEVWEALPPVNGHTGIFAYHMDDCLCGMGGWPCFRDGSVSRCCGSTDVNSKCSKADEKW